MMSASAGSAHHQPRRESSRPDQHARRDVDVAARMGGVRYQELALQLLSPPMLVPRHQGVDAQAPDQDHQLGIGHLRCAVRAGQPRHGAPRELEAGDREEADDRQRSQRLELAVPVGVILVGCLGRHADDDEGRQVVQAHRPRNAARRPGRRGSAPRARRRLSRRRRPDWRRKSSSTRRIRAVRRAPPSGRADGMDDKVVRRTRESIRGTRVSRRHSARRP